MKDADIPSEEHLDTIISTVKDNVQCAIIASPEELVAKSVQPK